MLESWLQHSDTLNGITTMKSSCSHQPACCFQLREVFVKMGFQPDMPWYSHHWEFDIHAFLLKTIQ